MLAQCGSASLGNVMKGSDGAYPGIGHGLFEVAAPPKVTNVVLAFLMKPWSEGDSVFPKTSVTYESFHPTQD